MRNTIAIILALCLCVGLCACGGDTEPTEVEKSIEAQKADELILAIGDVSIDSEPAILAAQTYYQSLTDSQQAEVENISTLENAVEKLDELKKAIENRLLQEKAYESLLEYIRNNGIYRRDKDAYYLSEKYVANATQYLFAHDDNRLTYLYNVEYNQTGFSYLFGIEVNCSSDSKTIYFQLGYTEIVNRTYVEVDVSGILSARDWSRIYCNPNSVRNCSESTYLNQIDKEIEVAIAFFKKILDDAGLGIDFEDLLLK